VSILIDTHVFLWAAGMGERLSMSARTLLEDVDTPIFFSAASAWEISSKWAMARLHLPAHPGEFIKDVVAAAGLSQLSISVKDATVAAELPFHHKDPFDRLLVAQARTNSLRLMTADPIMEKYDVDVIALWLDDEDE